jgi:hypothetical protein
MDKSDFDAFVRRENEAANEPSFDVVAQKNEWLDYLNALYANIEDFLKEYVDAGQLRIIRKTIQIDEEQTGPYDAPQLVIGIGRKVIKVVPIGTFLVGTKGRVDVDGPTGNARLVLADKSVTRPSQLIRVSVISVGRKSLTPPPPPTKRASEIEWTWKIVGKPPKLDFQELTKERFLEVLAEVGNG